MPGKAAKTMKSGALRAAREAMYRSHILDVAEATFAEQGFASTRMQDIAQAAEISLATLYQLYPGKQDLYRQILIQRDQELMACVLDLLPGSFGPEQSLLKVLDLLAVQLNFLLAHPNYLKMQLQDGQFWFHSDTRPSAAEQQIWERGMQLMEQLFNWGVEAGFFTPGEPPDQARMLLSLQQTRLANWVHGGMQETHAETVARIQADFIRFFCRPAVATQFLSADGQVILR